MQPSQFVVCGCIVPDPLQTLEPVTGPAGPSLKNEMMLPAVLDPWAGHALYEAANLAKKAPGSKVWLVSLIVTGDNSTANIVVCDHTLSNHSFLTNSRTEILVGNNSSLNYDWLQNENGQSTHINNL